MPLSRRIICATTVVVIGCNPAQAQQSIVPVANTPTTVQAVGNLGNQWQIGQGSQAGTNLFHDFQQFNLPSGQVANFLSNPTIANIFSRVSGGSPSFVDGLLQVTGSQANLFLINPSGIIFGQNARLDLPGSFTAITADGVEFGQKGWLKSIGSNDYQSLIGQPTGYAFTTSTPGVVLNAGNLSVQPQQSLTLMGGTVINTGTISAPGGAITIAAVPGEQLVRINQVGALLSLELPIAVHQVIAPGKSPAQLPELLTGGPEIGATALETIDGVTKLTQGRAIAIVSGPVTGSTVDITGTKISLVQANIQAGQIHIGGDFQGQGDRPRAQQVNVDAASRLQASKIIVWSDGSTQFAGSATAPGGLVETSGKQTLDVAGARVQARDWLLDPSDITIGNIAALNTIAPATIEAALDMGTNVTIATSGGTGGNGDIHVDDAINQTGGGMASLTLTGRRIGVPLARINLTSTGDLTFNLNQVNPEAVVPASSIQNAIDTIGTVPGIRQINLAAGVYSATTPIVVDQPVRINGGDRNTTTITGNNATQVIRVLDRGAELTLENTTIQNGNSIDYGGAIHTSGKLTVRNSAFRNNQAVDDGGAIRADTDAQNTTIDSSFFSNNSAKFGGAIENSAGLGSLVTITGSTFTNNNATRLGGAVLNDSGGRMAILNSTLDRNSAPLGGAIANADNADLNLTLSTVNDNIATDSGGGIATFSNSRLTIDRTPILRNQATGVVGTVGGVGGGILADRATTSITLSPVEDNIAKADGGAIYQNYGALSVNTSNFARNQGRDGGAIAAIGGDLDLLATDFTNNQATRSGGAIENSSFQTLFINRGIFSNNQANNLGGAIQNQSTATIFDADFIGNQAGTATFGGGGAINNGLAAELDITQSRFIGNQTTQSGGAIDSFNSQKIKIQTSVFQDNVAQLDGGAILADRPVALEILQSSSFLNNRAGRDGGALYTSGTNVIAGATFDGNRAGRNGGAIFATGQSKIDQTTLSNNRASRNGGAIDNRGALAITTTKINGNMALSGGGIFNGNGATLTVDRGLFQGNEVQSSGGGIYNQSGNVKIINSQILGNLALNNAGGGISDNGGTTQITGVTIADNQARLGGGIEATASRLTLDNVTVQNNRSVSSGGGIELTSMLQTLIQNSRILNNQTTGTGNGGGLGSYQSPVTIRDTTVSGNRSVGNGGGLEGNGSDLVLERVNLTSNIAVSGGGITNRSSPSRIANTTISDSQILSNQATQFGGGIYVRGAANTQIQGTTIAQNTAGINGGGIGSQATGVFNLIDSTVTQNTAAENGGGIDAYAPAAGLTTFNIANTTVAQNTANIYGGGISLALGQVFNLTNSTIVANQSQNGGGINSYGVTNLGNVTIANNKGLGGGVFAQRSGVVRLNNTIVATNGSSDVSGSFIDQGNNLIGISDGATGFTTSTLVGTSAAPIDPLLGALVDNGGLTQTLALLPGSRAIDAGSTNLATDQRGLNRLRAADIGAFESQALIIPPVIIVPPDVLPPDVLLPVTPSVVIPLPVTAPASVPAPVVVNTINVINPPDLPPTPVTRATIAAPQLSADQAGLEAIVALDNAFSGDYAAEFGTALGPKVKASGTSLNDTLRQLKQPDRGLPAVIYAIFVPAVISPIGAVTGVSSVPNFLRSREAKPNDRLELVLLQGDGKFTRRSTSFSRAQVAAQMSYFWLINDDVENKTSYAAFGNQFYQWLMQPIESDLKQAKIQTLIYVLDQGLRQIPVATMQRSPGTTSWVGNDYQMSVVASLGLLKPNIKQLHNQTTVAMGADIFKTLQPLPAVGTELDLIGRENPIGRKFLNQDFTFANLQQQITDRRPGILHLATHAQFNHGVPSKSYIQLWDRPLQIDQLKQLGLEQAGIELLVLSACNTASGSKEAELGFTGIASLSGVNTVLGSIWSVSDLGTLAFMTEFYGQLKTTPSRVEALRQTQQAMRSGQVRLDRDYLVTTQGRFPIPAKIQRQGSLDFVHPFYWAGFTMVGNPW